MMQKNSSRYEKTASCHLKYLQSRRIIKDLKQGYTDPKIGETKKFDFGFKVGNIKYSLEIDGEQHFEDGIFHSNNRCLDQKKRDYRYTVEAIRNGYFIIRIHHNDINSIKEHIMKALKSGNPYYFSRPECYLYITWRLLFGDN